MQDRTLTSAVPADKPLRRRPGRAGRAVTVLAILISLLGGLFGFVGTAVAYADEHYPLVPANGATVPYAPSNGGGFLVPLDTWDKIGQFGVDPCSASAAESTHMLPIERWALPSSRFISTAEPDVWAVFDHLAIGVRDAVGVMAMSAGTGMYSLTSNVVAMSTSFCPLQRFGGVMDSTAAQIGNYVVNSPLVMIAGVVLVIGFIFSKMRRDGAVTLGSVIKKIIAACLLVMIATGAAASTGGDGNQPYKPGFMSPGWLMSSVDRVTSTLATTLTSAFPTKLVPPGSPDITGHMNDPLSCVHYAAALNDQYRGTNAASTGASLVSQQWETAGLEVWRQAQFGSNEYANIVDCRLLEGGSPNPAWTVNIQGLNDVVGTVRSIQNSAFENVKGSGTTAAKFTGAEPPVFRGARSANPVSIVAFAACALNPGATDMANADSWRIRHVELLAPNERDEAAARQSCATLFTTDFASADVWKPFTWSGKEAGNVTDHVTDPDVLNFLQTMQGGGAAGSAFGMIMFIIGGIATIVVVGGMSAGVAIAKVASVLMGVMLVLVLLWSLFGRGSEQKLGSYAKQYIGLSFFTFAFGLLMTIVTMVMNLVTNFVYTMAPQGGIVAVSLVALSPLVAALLVKTMFKKIGLPNPVSIAGGLAFANAARTMSADSLGSGGEGAAARGVSRAAGRAKGFGRGVLAGTPLGRTAAGRAVLGHGNTAANAVVAGGTAAGLSALLRKRGKDKDQKEAGEDAGDVEKVESADTSQVDAPKAAPLSAATDAVVEASPTEDGAGGATGGVVPANRPRRAATLTAENEQGAMASDEVVAARAKLDEASQGGKLSRAGEAVAAAPGRVADAVSAAGRTVSGVSKTVTPHLVKGAVVGGAAVLLGPAGWGAVLAGAVGSGMLAKTVHGKVKSAKERRVAAAQGEYDKVVHEARVAALSRQTEAQDAARAALRAKQEQKTQERENPRRAGVDGSYVPGEVVDGAGQKPPTGASRAADIDMGAFSPEGSAAPTSPATPVQPAEDDEPTVTIPKQALEDDQRELEELRVRAGGGDDPRGEEPVQGAGRQDSKQDQLSDGGQK